MMSNMAAQITIPGNPRPTLTVDLVGVEYTVRVPKGAIAMHLSKQFMQVEGDIAKSQSALYAWIDVLFGKTTGKAVKKRLEDPEDDLDLNEIGELIRAVMETGGNPTT